MARRTIHVCDVCGTEEEGPAEGWVWVQLTPIYSSEHTSYDLCPACVGPFREALAK